MEISCRCPCGQTDFIHGLSPPPNCLTNRHSNSQRFPEIIVSHSGVDRQDIRRMEDYLVAETTSIKNEYAKFGLAVYNWTKYIDGINTILKAMIRFQQCPTAGLTTFDEIFEAATRDADYINHEPLFIIIDECGRRVANDESYFAIQTAKEHFQQAFKKFAQQRVFSLPGGLDQPPLPIPEGFYRDLILKIEEDYHSFTIERLMYFKKIIHKVLQLPEQIILRVTSVREGCVEITFRVIGSVSEGTFELSPDQKKTLLKHNIMMLQYNGLVPYCCCELTDKVM